MWVRFPPLAQRIRLDDVVQATSNLPFGGTNCALPLLWALERGVEADLFAVYTDSETWFGEIHPSQALVRYREQTGIAARLAVVGMVSNGFTIADPNDAGMLDVVGFDTATLVRYQNERVSFQVGMLQTQVRRPGRSGTW